MIIQINKTVYQSLSESERCVIDFINQNETKIPLLSITSIAEKTFTSPATVTRAIQKCGFQGITELRYKLSQGTQSEQSSASPYAVNEILDKTFRECTKTIDNLNITSILHAIEYIKSSKRILIYARGFTALIAEEFQMYLQLLGYDAVIQTRLLQKKIPYSSCPYRIQQKNWQNLPELPSESALKSSPAAVRLLLIWNSILTLH